MTEAPKRIWATINGQRSVLPGSERYLIGGWEGAPREHGREYILAAEHDRIVAEKDAEIARLTAERDAIAALTVERCAGAIKSVVDGCAIHVPDSPNVYTFDYGEFERGYWAAIRSLSPIPPHVAAARVVRVKPLVWEDTENALFAVSAVGRYSIWYRPGRTDADNDLCTFRLNGEKVQSAIWFDECNGWEEAAKAAAQSDCEARIRSGLMDQENSNG